MTTEEQSQSILGNRATSLFSKNPLQLAEYQSKAITRAELINGVSRIKKAGTQRLFISETYPD